MRELARWPLAVSLLAPCCATGKIKPDTGDKTSPEITLSVTALDVQ